MKIYDKEALFVTILDLAIIALAVWNIVGGEVEIHHIAILLYACSGLKTNIKAVFSEEDSKKRQKQVGKRIGWKRRRSRAGGIEMRGVNLI